MDLFAQQTYNRRMTMALMRATDVWAMARAGIVRTTMSVVRMMWCVFMP